MGARTVPLPSDHGGTRVVGSYEPQIWCIMLAAAVLFGRVSRFLDVNLRRVTHVVVGPPDFGIRQVLSLSYLIRLTFGYLFLATVKRHHVAPLSVSSSAVPTMHKHGLRMGL